MSIARTIALTLLMSILAATTSQAAVVMHLTPLPDQPVTPEGFTLAELTIADANTQLPTAARAVSLRRSTGGATVFYEASIAPGASGNFRVLLPMVSVRQAYTIRLLAGTAPTSAVILQQDVTAETDNVGEIEAARNLLLDSPAYDDYIEDLPRWPTWALRNAFLVPLLMMVGMGATLLIRRPVWRVLAAGLVVAAASGVIYESLANCPLVITRQDGEIRSVSCRRTTTWSTPAHGLGPIYWRTKQMDQDDMIYQPARMLTLTLHPNEVRLFRRRTNTPTP